MEVDRELTWLDEDWPPETLAYPFKRPMKTDVHKMTEARKGVYSWLIQSIGALLGAIEKEIRVVEDAVLLQSMKKLDTDE